jgi:hypothetical protein
MPWIRGGMAMPQDLDAHLLSLAAPALLGVLQPELEASLLKALDGLGAAADSHQTDPYFDGKHLTVVRSTERHEAPKQSGTAPALVAA